MILQEKILVEECQSNLYTTTSEFQRNEGKLTGKVSVPFKFIPFTFIAIKILMKWSTLTKCRYKIKWSIETKFWYKIRYRDFPWQSIWKLKKYFHFPGYFTRIIQIRVQITVRSLQTTLTSVKQYRDSKYCKQLRSPKLKIHVGSHTVNKLRLPRRKYSIVALHFESTDRRKGRE